MVHVISFSGGKDSAALCIWAKKNIDNCQFIFADTGWEHEITYQYIDAFNEYYLDNKLITVKSNLYDGMRDMVIKRKEFPRPLLRYCTQFLKIAPIREYLKSLEEEHINVVGVRKAESRARAKLSERGYDSYLGCDVWRPLINWSSADVFVYLMDNKVEINPLYRMGMKRVGCMPCIMCGIGELRQIIKRFPETIKKVADLEHEVGSTFFADHVVPERARKTIIEGQHKSASMEDIQFYLSNYTEQMDLFEEEIERCMSSYNLCE